MSSIKIYAGKKLKRTLKENKRELKYWFFLN